MVDNETAIKLSNDLQRVREERLDLLPQSGTLIEVVADAMNALEVAWVVLAAEARQQYQSPQGATFVPVSNPQDAKNL